MRYILYIATPFTLLILLYPEETVGTIIKLHERIDPLVVQILSLAFYIRIFGWVGGQVLIVTRKSPFNMKINRLLCIIFIPLLILIIPNFE